jgi:hypothetical protein
VDVYSEDLRGPALPDWAETFLAQERNWRRLLRGTGMVTAENAAEDLRRWMRA